MKKLLFILLFSQFYFAQKWSISFAERNALLNIYNATSGNQWSQQWNFEKDPKTWYGVKVKNGIVTELNLRGNGLKGNFPTNVSSLRNLERLDLSNNQLSGEVAPSISSLSVLKSIDISNNKFSGDPTVALVPLTQLTELSLGNNDFQIADLEGLLQNFTKLMVLDISHFGLSMVPQKIAQMPKLMALNISNNQLTQGFGHISSLAKLQELDISGNALTQIPNELGALTGLVSLNASNNKLGTIFVGPLANYKNLEWLSLQGNDFTAFPPAITQLTKLVHLNFSDNKIKDGFHTLRVLKNLEQIFLDKNEIATFPETLLQLKGLQMLSLTNNKITGEIPDLIPALTFLDNNRFTTQQIRNFILKNKKLANFTYSPQRYDEATTVSVNLGASANLQQSLSGGEYQFTWFKNLDQKTTTTAENYYISNTQESDFTDYTCEAYYFEELPAELMEVSFFREPITLSKDLGTENVNKGLVVFPNPATDFLYIKTTRMNIEKVFIHDLSGKLLYTGNEKRIKVAQLPSATYVISIQTSEGLKSFKFIKH